MTRKMIIAIVTGFAVLLAVIWTSLYVVPYFVGLVVYLIARQARTARCPNCGWAAPADAAFCPRCGQALQGRCAGCRGRVPNDVKFCPGCGVAVGTP